MSGPYRGGPGTRGGSGYADDSGPLGGRDEDSSYGSGYQSKYSSAYDSTYDYGVSDYEVRDYDGFGENTDSHARAEEHDDADFEAYGQPDNRWRWVAGLAAVVLLIAVVATMALIGGGDSTSTGSSTPLSVVPQTTPRTVIATVPPSASDAPPLPSETVVTVTPSPSPSVHSDPDVTASAAPLPPDTNTNTITYTVSGSRQLFDLVTIIYTDEQGFPRTDINVALPWSRTVTLNPGVTIESVTATSVAAQLNCAITDAAGTTLAAQNNNAMIANCTQ